MRRRAKESRCLVIGSRSSKLAMAQTRCVAAIFKRLYPDRDFDIRTIKTTGDRIPDIGLSAIGDKGIFTREIEEALLKREIDLAVHSMKDLPTELPQGLEIAAVTKREDPRDCLVSSRCHDIKALPQGARVGTSSLRRRAQLLHMRRDLNVLELRGNVDTRVEKLRRGLYDAIVVAHAGIKRLGLKVSMSVIPVDQMLPQAGQGALGIETRAADQKVLGMVKALDDADSRLSSDAERSVLARLGGGCQVPIGVYADITEDRIVIKAGVFSLDGSTAVTDEITGLKKDAASLGRRLAEKILGEEAACRILDEIRK